MSWCEQSYGFTHLPIATSDSIAFIMRTILCNDELCARLFQSLYVPQPPPFLVGGNFDLDLYWMYFLLQFLVDHLYSVATE